MKLKKNIAFATRVSLIINTVYIYIYIFKNHCIIDIIQALKALIVNRV